ncbi:MAG TPA: TRAP transporter substrate-binding protein [Candidatus Methylomirabilis sp.]|nr:TRAP transporter substrate-binding protein [Candidatus Methylomirabilis sp.]HSC71373.1 TRAP transporter substrate-binding protein [Candidatus Methylomirabilis sp.]
MDRRRFLQAVGVAAGSLALPGTAGAAYKFKLSTEGSDTHQTTIWARAFADAVAKKSGGQIGVDVFTNGQLGKNKELLEAISMSGGTVEIVATGTQDLVGWVPETQVFDLPFLFRDEAHYRKFWGGDVAGAIWKKMEGKGFKYLGSTLIGTAHMTNSKRPINTPADMAGLKFRVQASKVNVETFKALGATPVPLAFSEVFMALQQGTVDGQDNPTTTIRTMNFWEVQKYVSLTGHMLRGGFWSMDKKVFDKLPGDLQKAVLDAGKEAEDYEWKFVQDDQAKSLAFLKEKGLAINTPPGMDPFRDKVKGVAALVGGNLPELAEQARSLR